jgi:hypothetical protein
MDEVCYRRARGADAVCKIAEAAFSVSAGVISITQDAFDYVVFVRTGKADRARFAAACVELGV